MPEGCERIEFSVPFRLDSEESRQAARLLAVQYLRSALEYRGALYSEISERLTVVERSPDNGFWAPVVRDGWAFVTIGCFVETTALSVAS